MDGMAKKRTDDFEQTLARMLAMPPDPKKAPKARKKRAGATAKRKGKV